LIVILVVIIIAVVSVVAAVRLSGFSVNLQPTPTLVPSQTPQPTPVSTPQATPELIPASFSNVTMDNSGNGVIRGYLTRGSWNNGCIPNATIEIVDAVNGTVYGQTKTLSELNKGNNLNVGGFSFTLPASDVGLSVQAVFRGDSEWDACTSVVVSINPQIFLGYYQ
jgi:hypothetical protein